MQLNIDSREFLMQADKEASPRPLVYFSELE